MDWSQCITSREVSMHGSHCERSEAAGRRRAITGDVWRQSVDCAYRQPPHAAQGHRYQPIWPLWHVFSPAFDRLQCASAKSPATCHHIISPAAGRLDGGLFPPDHHCGHVPCAALIAQRGGPSPWRPLPEGTYRLVVCRPGPWRRAGRRPGKRRRGARVEGRRHCARSAVEESAEHHSRNLPS